ncbi:MAG: divergent PAP2 family protein [Minisyncoccus archaeiphilus]|jgi:acid phosphatase family membrane protein YuiD|uniref:divergent PAP2 family protein n=1 Tax=Minisyncoccus archaeiphilus TaxID=3238481 RepID=UPI0009C87DE3|nr:MAG: Divergent PAP2 family protein [Parcubacteria group bacterium ADurb.Bin216]GMX60054.1 MAG: divergent PAP2 family protein [Candidatus Parcubacteria bacterium]
MEEIYSIIGNKVLISSVLGWFIAQTMKAILLTFKYKKFRLDLYALPGGFPSSHSATSSALVMACGLYAGFDSAIFAVSCILAFFIIYDAKVIRVASGKQAQSLNRLIELIGEEKNQQMDKLKEILGHSLMEITCGILIGIFSALLIYTIW